MLVYGTCFLLYRMDYDRLLARYPSWFANVWPRISGRWHLSGVSVDDRYYKRFQILLKGA